MELVTWLEHATCWLRISCTTDCATLAFHLIFLLDNRNNISHLTHPVKFRFKTALKIILASQFDNFLYLCRVSCKISPSIIRLFSENHAFFRQALFYSFDKVLYFLKIFFWKTAKFSSLFFAYILRYIYIMFLIILHYKKLYTFSTRFSTSIKLLKYKEYLQFSKNCQKAQTLFYLFLFSLFLLT